MMVYKWIFIQIVLIKDGRLQLSVDGGTPYTMDYDFSNDYQTLTIINLDGDDAILIKQ